VATFRDLKAFVERDGWHEEANLARGRPRRGDHLRYRKELPDGSILRTKVPHNLRDEIGPDLFRHILRDQLRVTDDQFWAVVRRGPIDPTVSAPPQEATIPGWLVARLIYSVGLSEAEVREMTLTDALAAWDAWQTKQRS
jgi:hypothetical protein